MLPRLSTHPSVRQQPTQATPAANAPEKAQLRDACDKLCRALALSARDPAAGQAAYEYLIEQAAGLPMLDLGAMPCDLLELFDARIWSLVNNLARACHPEGLTHLTLPANAEITNGMLDDLQDQLTELREVSLAFNEANRALVEVRPGRVHLQLRRMPLAARASVAVPPATRVAGNGATALPRAPERADTGPGALPVQSARTTAQTIAEALDTRNCRPLREEALAIRASGMSSVGKAAAYGELFNRAARLAEQESREPAGRVRVEQMKVLLIQLRDQLGALPLDAGVVDFEFIHAALAYEQAMVVVQRLLQHPPA
jgi:hypothetical protein